jgi:predicted dinucleotide-binding enzyme
MTASATPAPVATVGILGAGRVGTAVAHQALGAGYRVLIAASGDPADIELIVDVMAPGAVAVTAAEAARRSDVVILSLPLRKYRSLDPSSMRGKVVVDTMNLWPETDGDISELAASASSSEMVQAFLSDARVVKTLNHIGYHELETDGTPAGTPGRRALAVAGDDRTARVIVMRVVERLGYDAVDAGPLSAGAAFSPGTPVFDGRHDRTAMTSLLELFASDVDHGPLVSSR